MVVSLNNLTGSCLKSAKASARLHKFSKYTHGRRVVEQAMYWTSFLRPLRVRKNVRPHVDYEMFVRRVEDRFFVSTDISKIHGERLAVHAIPGLFARLRELALA